MEEKKEILTITDTSRIKAVKFKYPGLMGETAEGVIKSKYSDILKIRDSLLSCREQVRMLENLLKERENEFREMTALCTIEYETYQKEHIVRNGGTLFKNLGNDILGRFSN